MATCPYCGSRNDDGVQFCAFCGAKMDDPQTIRSVPEPPMPEVPEIPEAPEIPAEPVVTAADAAPEAPVPTPQPQPTYAQPQPTYAQPIYPEQPKKKSKKWLIPVIILAVLATFAIGALLLRGFVGRVTEDPNLGTYKATSMSMYGLDIDPDDIFEGGFVIELQPGGICKIQAGENKGSGTWKIEDGVITVNDGSSNIEGKLDNGVITIENMLDMGLDITLVRQEE